ncbi:Zinc finger, GRF-type [Sesbania bispinosa]|nr:Zinc finger, GRF-type [Sesbania bispinosa]
MMGSASSNPQFLHQRRSTTPTWSSSASSMANAAEIMGFKTLHCHCGRRVIIRVSKTDRNPGRPFYSCSLPKMWNPNHNIRNCMNFGVPPKPRGWKPVEATEVPTAPTNPTTTTENENEPQIEIDVSQSQPTTQPSQPQNVNTIQELSPNPNQATVSAAPTQTTRLLPTRGGLSIRPHVGFTGPSASSPTTIRPTGTPGPTSTADPFHGPSASSDPISAARPFQGANASSGPISAARPFQGATSSSPTTVRPSGTSGPISAAGPFQGASAGTTNRFMQFIPTLGIRPPPPKNIDYNLIK